MKRSKNLFYKEFLNRENIFLRAPFVPEFEFYSAIKSGNVRRVKKLCEEPLFKKNWFGRTFKKSCAKYEISFCDNCGDGGAALH